MMSSSFYDVIFDLDNDVISKERLANVTYFLSMRQLLPFSPILFAPDCSMIYTALQFMYWGIGVDNGAAGAADAAPIIWLVIVIQN